MTLPSTVTVAIVTYNRGSVLVQTLERVRRLQPPPGEIVVIDQTPSHAPAVMTELGRLNDAGEVRWIRTSPPSIPISMNRALKEATGQLTLFIDDDVEPDSGLISAHQKAYVSDAIWAAAGRVLESRRPPGAATRRRTGLTADLEFDFTSEAGAYVENVMAGNLSVRRDRALSIGGFDEQFLGAAYRFETDIARRLVAAGGKIWFTPTAVVKHLKLQEGGIRSFGDHLKSPSPTHCVGDYYFAWRHGSGLERLRYITRRLSRAAATRYHLRHPWWIPSKLLGEIRGLILGRRLARQGPRLLAR